MIRFSRWTPAGGVLALLLAGCAATGDAPPMRVAGAAPAWDAPGNRNPLLPGYFADPSIVQDGGRWHIFATIDPWGSRQLGLWTSENGRDWSFSRPEWPTKAAATTPDSSDAMVWAPSVIRARNGQWFMYVSVGSEVWVGTAPSAAGPWRDANGGKPLIAKSFAPEYHMIDAEAFIDDDGTAYLYWGSGHNWQNGHCFAVRLKPDMVTFDGEPVDVTPANYFEAPLMVKQGDRYLLTYSDGKTTTDTYKVRYAVGDTPFGPFQEAANSPILVTDDDRNVISPGHHTIFRSGGQPYILYHRQALPWVPGRDEVLRQVVIDPLDVRSDGTIANVRPSHGGDVAGFAAHRTTGLGWTASGTGGDTLHGPDRAADNNYATLWQPAAAGPAQLVADLGSVRQVTDSELRPEFADRAYRFGIDVSTDGRQWRTVVPVAEQQGSPIRSRLDASARYVRLVFPEGGAAVWEWVLR
ncbi:family 43 glycosylhydrolase [Croceibacterium ferulae]|uniref:family 43 glycosylhydrolase n=1 Tax=Croceibacterium ferulae TaxID=1854641 RepID=UPI001F4D7AAE|nr:family 43 glycosylhydrolase [Croceibacterium ferulae]